MRAPVNFKGMRLTGLFIDKTVNTDLAPSARYAAERYPREPEEHHPGPGYPPRNEEPLNPSASHWDKVRRRRNSGSRYDKGEFAE